MPNYCHNQVTLVATDKEMLDKIIEKEGADKPYVNYATNGLCFEKILPLSNGENPRVLWGTPKNALTCLFKRVSETELEWHFDSAWSPPIPVLEKLVNKYRGLDIYGLFFEMGNQMGGNINTYADEESSTSPIEIITDDWSQKQLDDYAKENGYLDDE